MPDFDEPHANGNGFDSSVCDQCEHHDTDGMVNTCGLCGCPTASGMPMSILGAPPESCPYLEEHAQADDDDGGLFKSARDVFSSDE